MILFYRERGSGDFLAIDTATNRYYVDTFSEDHFEARATAIERQVGSVCASGVSGEFLKIHCEKVARRPSPGVGSEQSDTETGGQAS